MRALREPRRLTRVHHRVSPHPPASVSPTMRAVSPLPPDSDGPPGRPGEARSAEEESALVARVLAGDHEALGQLVAPYVGSLRRVARALLGDGGDAGDAGQDELLLPLVE